MDTNVTTPQVVATIIAIEGQAFSRDPAGQMRPLKPGDVLLEGDTIVTMPGGQVQLAFLDGQSLTLLPNETFQFSAETSPGTRPEVAEAALPAGEAERIIQALERGENIDDLLEDTAAGLEGGGNNAGNGFVRLLRIVEGTGSTSFEFGSAELASSATFDATRDLTAAAATVVPPAVGAANTPPVANPDTLTVNEDPPMTIDVLANDTDADGNVLTVASASASNGTVVVNSDGTITYTPNPDYNGPDSITYSISDGEGGSATATVTVNVAAVNDAPVANADTLAATEDTPVTYAAADLLGNDSDADGNTLTIASVTSGAGGTAVLNADGSVTFTPNANFNGAADFSYTVTDGSLTSNSASVTVNVAAVNDAPTISVSASAFAEDDGSAFDGALAATYATADQENDAITVAFTAGSNDDGFYALVDGQVVLTQAGADHVNAGGLLPSVDLTVSDGSLSASASDTPAVTPANDAPVNALPSGYTTSEDVPLKLSGLSVADVDADSGAITVTLTVERGTLTAADLGGVTVTGSGTASIVLTGALAAINTYLAAAASQPTYVPVADDSGTVTLTMTTNDAGNTGSGGPLSDSDSISITIDPVADAIPESAISLVIGTPVINTISFGESISGLDGASTYTFARGITMSTGSSDTTFTWSQGSLLGVTAGAAGDNRISGTDAIEFSFPYGMQYMAMKLKNAADDSILLRSDLEVGDLTTGTLSGAITSSSSTTVSSATLKVDLVLQVWNGTATTTVTLSATVSSSGTWAVDYSGIYGTITQATVVSYVNGSLFNQGGNTSADLAYSISSDITSLSIAQDTANRYSKLNNGFQIEYVDIGTDSSGATTYTYPIDLYAVIQDTVGTTEVFTSLTLSDFPAGSTLSVAHADGSYTEINPVNDIYDLSAYTDLLNSPTDTSGTDKLYLITSSPLPSGFAPTLAVEVSDGGTSSAVTIIGGADDSTHIGDAGNDILIGGAGNDTLVGGLGADVFTWELADQGSPGAPAVDTITDFDSTANSDKLDLRDLLVGESHLGVDLGNLANYLHFETSGSDTVIQISSSGGFSGGFDAGATDQTIILNGIDLSSGGTLGADQQIIQDLLSKGKLITD